MSEKDYNKMEWNDFMGLGYPDPERIKTLPKEAQTFLEEGIDIKKVVFDIKELSNPKR